MPGRKLVVYITKIMGIKAKIKETPLSRLKAVENKFNIGKVFVKDESYNPFGTVKDRRSALIVEKANRVNVDKLVLLTSGNSGLSLNKFAVGYGIKTVCVISRHLPDLVKRKLRSKSCQTIEVNLDHKILRPEEVIAFARETEEESIWEVTNGYEDSYSSIVDEIKRYVIPDYIVVPVGSGGIFVGIIEAINHYKLKTKVIGVTSRNTTSSFADKLTTPWTPYSRTMKNYLKEGHKLFYIKEKEIEDTYKRYKKVVNCEPSSSIVFAALNVFKFKKSDTVVFLNSGVAKI